MKRTEPSPSFRPSIPLAKEVTETRSSRATIGPFKRARGVKVAAVPPRQVAVLSVANYDELCRAGTSEAGEAAVATLRQQAVDCGVDEGYMRALDDTTLLLRLDDLSREDFLATIKCLTERTRTFPAPTMPEFALKVRVGAMSERALRSLVNDAARDLLSYMNHMESSATFLAGDELDIWQQMASVGIEVISHEQLKYLDPFTGMLKVERFAELLQYALDDPRMTEGMAVIYLDIDDFKSYNRTFSHDAGDKLLLFVARQIREAFSTDIVTHLSVDRFAVLTNSPDIASKCAAIHAATRAFDRSFAPELKCGVFVLEDAVHSPYIAIDCAKLACESIKGRYDISYRCFSQDLKDRLYARRYVARHAERAVNDGWIRTFAQPVIDTLTGDLCGFEALARWNDPDRGLLSPAMFIPTLEATHLIHTLDMHVVETVCKYLARRRDEGLPYVPASVNLSRLDFGLCDVLGTISELCKRWDIPHHLLAIEITESALQEGSDIRDEMDRFRAAGFEVWMDDFGCGYSSLNLLKDYEFDVLKVDMEFLRDMESNARSKKIVASVLDMAKKLGIRTLVEGVETEAQYEFLRDAGCDMMQGYLFGKPGPLELFTPSEE